MSGARPSPTSGSTHRVVVLCGPHTAHKNTCATLIRARLNVVGICMADQRKAGLPLPYLLKSVRQKGLWPTLSRAGAKVVYRLMDLGRDRAAMSRIFDEPGIDQTLRAWNGPVHKTESFSAPETIEWLKATNPDIFVVHSSYWVGKKVRNLPSTGIVLGGHPGITPNYRGSQSAFWAIYFGRQQDVGCTAFLLNEGVDTGDIVSQDRIPIDDDDSFVTLSWKGMKRTAELQAAAIADLDRGLPLNRRSVAVPANSEFDNPRLGEFLRYRWRQQRVR
jgi:hypothetical protein